jgi:DNA-binding MarR family transcriptional regulator
VAVDAAAPPASIGTLLRALRRTAAQHSLFVQLLAAKLGIGATDLDCLLLLHDLGPASAGQLADVLGLTTGAITGVVDRLAAAGFVVREADPADRRRVIIQPVAEQARRVDESLEPLLDVFSRALTPLSDSSLSQLIEYERCANAALDEAIWRLRAVDVATGSLASFSAPLGALEAATLEFPTGAVNVRILAATADADDLYHATFQGIQPSLRVQGGTLAIRYKRLGLFEWGSARHVGVVALNPNIPWSLALRGGATGVSLDARGLDLRGVTVAGGANKLEVSLPAPRGSVLVAIDGSAHRVQIQRPGDVAMQLQVRGGANRLEFDTQRFGAVGGDLRLASRGWELASDRYSVEVRGGASRLTIHEV